MLSTGSVLEILPFAHLIGQAFTGRSMLGLNGEELDIDYDRGLDC